MGDGSNQLAEVGNLLEWLAPAAERPVVVVGDFNSRPGSPAYARLVDAGLVDAYATHADEPGPVATAEFLHLRMHIDHLFSTPAVRWTDVRAHSVDHGPFRGLSDHAPKLGRVRAAA
jgi:endonuclease/exonuclease/phosphatase family metal-dependent hydrolase